MLLYSSLLEYVSAQCQRSGTGTPHLKIAATHAIYRNNDLIYLGEKEEYTNG
jgi:hypothetical protein